MIVKGLHTDREFHICIFSTGGCASVKESQKSNIDKEYSMEISANCDTHVRLFCRGMNTDSPKEYISLFSVQKENFAYVHDYIQPSASKDSCVKANGKETLVFVNTIFYFSLCMI